MVVVSAELRTIYVYCVLCTLYCVLCTIQYSAMVVASGGVGPLVYCVYCVLCTSILCIVYYVLCIMYCVSTVCIVYYALCIVYYARYR